MKKIQKWIGLTIALILLFGILIWNWQPDREELSVKLAAIDRGPMDGKEGILLVFDYDWSAAAVPPFSDQLTVEWSRGWKVSQPELQKLRTQKFVEQAKIIGHRLVMTLHIQTFHANHGQGKIFLTPIDQTHLNETIYSAANVKYTHRSLFGHEFAISSSTGWKNALILQTAAKN